MSDRIEPFAVTVPAGTVIASYQDSPLSFRDGKVDRLEISVPPGPSGLVGFRIAHSGQSVIPYTGERWIVADNEHIDWDMDNYPTGDAWSLWAYNDDVYDHTIYLRFHVTEIADTIPLIGVPIDIQPLATAEDIGDEFAIIAPGSNGGSDNDSAD